MVVSHDDFKYDVTDDSLLSTFVMSTSVNAVSIIFLVSHSFHFDKISFHSFSHLLFLLNFLTNDFVNNIQILHCKVDKNFFFYIARYSLFI